MIGLSSSVYPTRGVEVLFLAGFLLCSFLFASTLVSSFSAMLMDLQMQNQELTDRMRTLKFFLYQHNVHPGLALQVQRQIQNCITKEMAIMERDVEVLGMLSTTMRTQLRHTLYAPHLRTCPFFKTCEFFSPSFIQDLCFSG